MDIELAEPVCKQAAGTFKPVIDRNKCEGKADCVTVCPTDVFEIGRLQSKDRVGLSLKGRVKGIAHGWKQAFMPNIDACQACGKCVAACPEHAITLSRT